MYVNVGVSDAVLKACDSCAQSLSADHHVCCLVDLKLVSVFTEEGSKLIEGPDGVGQVRNNRIGRRRGLVPSKVIVARVWIVVVVVQTVAVLDHAVKRVNSSGSTSQKGSSESFHSKIFINLRLV